MAQEAKLLPIVLRTEAKPVGLTGTGQGLARRRKALAKARLRVLEFSPEALHREPLTRLHFLFIAGLPKHRAAALAAEARAAGVLVNVEDEPELCDFYMPAVIQRGDLLISVSTSGKSPGLAKLIRQWIERRLGLEWGGRVAELASDRHQWRGAGITPDIVSQKTAALVAERGWLP